MKRDIWVVISPLELLKKACCHMNKVIPNNLYIHLDFTLVPCGVVVTLCCLEHVPKLIFYPFFLSLSPTYLRDSTSFVWTVENGFCNDSSMLSFPIPMIYLS